ncbi:MAG: hypothetical protein ACYDEB_03120, partial [Dehalococcoidia bacterium]
GRLAVHAPGGVAELPADYAAHYAARVRGNPLRLAIEWARFGWRRMAPDAAPVLRELAREHEVYVVTGRSEAGRALIARWLRRAGLADRVGLRMAPPGLRPAQHKLAVSKMLGIDTHVDDDPRTAYYLAEHGVPRVYLLDHAGAYGAAPRPPRLALARSLVEVVRSL